MQFRNFDKIGLETEEQIRKFLGEKYIKYLQANEDALKNILQENWDIDKLLPKIDLETIVCLINDKAENGKCLLCVVEPGIYRIDEDTLGACYRIEAKDEFFATTSYPKIFKSHKETFNVVDDLYDTNSKDNITKKIMENGEEAE